MTRWLEWLAIAVLALALAIGVIALLSGGIAGSRDDPGLPLHRDAGPTGTVFRDQGDAHLRAGAAHPAYDSDPPTSGPHVPVAVTRNAAAMSDDQLLQAISRGDVVLLYSSSRPPRGLQAVADAVAPRFSAALGAAGQAVILGRRPGLRQITAVAWTRLLRSDDAEALRAFAQRWLGRGGGARASSVAGTG